MSRILALDIGTRHTGVAFLDESVAVPLPLKTIEHQTDEELITAVRGLLSERSIDRLVIGLPLLPSGTEGKQASMVREFVRKLHPPIAFSFVDERYTTPPKSSGNSHACAALTLLSAPLKKSSPKEPNNDVSGGGH